MEMGVRYDSMLYNEEAANITSAYDVAVKQVTALSTEVSLGYIENIIAITFHFRTPVAESSKSNSFGVKPWAIGVMRHTRK
jgi:hypothetical protein